MNRLNSLWPALLEGVDPNDPEAVARWRQELDDWLVRMVERVLRRGTAAGALDRRVLAAARVLSWRYPEQAADRDWLAREVAEGLSREWLAEAPAPFGGQGQLETVCA